MPHFDEDAYTDKRCYGVTEAELGRDTPGAAAGLDAEQARNRGGRRLPPRQGVGRGPTSPRPNARRPMAKAPACAPATRRSDLSFRDARQREPGIEAAFPLRRSQISLSSPGLTGRSSTTGLGLRRGFVTSMASGVTALAGRAGQRHIGKTSSWIPGSPLCGAPDDGAFENAYDRGQETFGSTTMTAINETFGQKAADERLDFADMRRRIKAIFIGSIGNLVEWYDFFAYAAFALYFASGVLPQRRSRGAAAQRRAPVRGRFPGAPARRLAVRPSRRSLRAAQRADALGDADVLRLADDRGDADLCDHRRRSRRSCSRSRASSRG